MQLVNYFLNTFIPYNDKLFGDDSIKKEKKKKQIKVALAKQMRFDALHKGNNELLNKADKLEGLLHNKSVYAQTKYHCNQISKLSTLADWIIPGTSLPLNTLATGGHLYNEIRHYLEQGTSTLKEFSLAVFPLASALAWETVSKESL